MAEAAKGQTNGAARADGGPFSFNQVLLAELRALRPEIAEFRARAGEPIQDPTNPGLNELERSNDLRETFQQISALSEQDRLAALCLSGGGIRSATFNLGVIQGLARLGLLDRFDYLSTVSGGGFIGGWLKAWMHRAGTRQVINELDGRVPPDHPLKPEPRPIDRLREYSNYLTPRRGLLSGDTGAVAAIVLRNLLLNWLVVVPVFMAAIAVPQIYYLAIQLGGGPAAAPWLLALAIALGLVTSIATHRFRRRPEETRTPSSLILPRVVLPFVGAAILLGLGAAWLDWNAGFTWSLLIFALLWCVLIPLAGWALREPFWALEQSRRFPLRELFAMVGSGAVAAGIFLLFALNVYPFLEDRPIVYALLTVPLLIGIYLLARALFVSMVETRMRKGAAAPASAGAHEDLDREWWARLSGYLLLIALSWIVFVGVALLGWHYAFRYLGSYAMETMSGAGVLSGLVAVLLGKSGNTGSGMEGGGKKPASRKMTWSLNTAAPLFCAVVVMVLAQLNALLGRAITGNATLLSVPNSLQRHETPTVGSGDLLVFVVQAVVLLGFGFLMGWFVNVNRFSLHGMYRDRLIRAYLGASNAHRNPDPFTGFATTDNVKMCDLWRAPVHQGDIDSRRPLHVVNATLNLVRGTRLAWQERKAESFSITPFYCGNFYEGYRRSSEYGGPGGISLGTAMAISGAAANPNMGCHSSPPITFLLGILNGRLGAWLGNTNVRGDRQDACRDQGPRWAVRPLFAELFGLTSSKTKYVQLSDGGHFDNLGLYEMVLRRCRFIVQCDAGRDPAIGFEDLGNVIRKIRIDFGVSIEFHDKITIAAKKDGAVPGLYCAIGTINYKDVDGHLAEPGTLIYIKPTVNVTGPLPYDVVSYAKDSEFPHESTADQWFDESQFESYRALGRHVVEQITAHPESPKRKDEVWSLEEFKKAVARHIKPPMPEPPAPAPVPAPAPIAPASALAPVVPAASAAHDAINYPLPLLEQL
jgi:hypothetical protein